jgi:hypothetical protein
VTPVFSIPQQLADLVADLVDHYDTRSEFVRDPTGPWDGKTYTVRHARWPMHAPGLVPQLIVLTGQRTAVSKPAPLGYPSSLGYHNYAPANSLLEASPLPAREYDTASSNRPTSRPPTRLDPLSLLDRISTGARHLRQAMGSHARRDVCGDLRQLVALSADAPVPLNRQALRAVRSWHAQTRVVLGYDAAVTSLPQAQCPDCGGELCVRSDVSSDVWCAGTKVVFCRVRDRSTHTYRRPGCGARWPRTGWAQMLAAATAAAPLVDTAAAAAALGVSPGHLRLLVSRSVLPGPQRYDRLSPGSPRTGMFDLAQLQESFDKLNSAG